MKAIELFAGAGGAALGLEAAGLEHAALCEWDADACATLRAAGLGPVVQGDVRDLDAIERVAGPSCDVLWSSFPCQAWSQAGARLGAEDPRNGWPWTVDAIDRFQPRWFLGENVRGIAQHRAACVARNGQALLFGDRPELSCPGCYLERVILPQLRKRFAFVGFWLLDAADYGVPQHRRRVVFWAGPAPLEQPKATHGSGCAAPWVSMAAALELREKRVIGGGRNPRKHEPEARSYRDLTDEPSTTIAAVQIGNAGPWVCPAPTVTAGDGHGLGGRATKDAVEAVVGRRRLTVQECATLQDFPDGYPFQGTSKTAQYRQIGNAVPPTLARVVAQAVVDAEGSA